MARNWVGAMTTEKEKVVYTSMVGDLFHIGHLNLLRRARRLGTRLVVGILTDECVKSYKNRTPIFSLEERIAIISSLDIVDKTVVQDMRDGSAIVKNMPEVEIIVRGDDADLRDERCLIESRGGQYILLPRTKGISTTGLIERIKRR